METETPSVPTKKTAAESADKLNGLVTSTSFNKGKTQVMSMSHSTQANPRQTPRTDAFAAALTAIPAKDWCRTWPADRTIMIRRTSKRVKETVDKMELPVVVRLSTVAIGTSNHSVQELQK